MTSATAPVPASTGSQFDKSLETMKTLESETDKWAFADALLDEVPDGQLHRFEDLRKEADEAGLNPASEHTLRMYRDTARRWPEDKRVEGVSFSAHRETTDPKVLRDLVKAMGGTGKVTVKAVREAAAAAAGNTAKAAKAKRAGFDAISDLLNNKGGKLIDAIDPAVHDLDTLQVGLNAVLAHVEKLRVKKTRASRKRGLQPVPSTPAAPQPKAVKAEAKEEATEAPKPRKPRGDLRGL
jgi:hypothetical protein